MFLYAFNFFYFCLRQFSCTTDHIHYILTFYLNNFNGNLFLNTCFFSFCNPLAVVFFPLFSLSDVTNSRIVNLNVIFESLIVGFYNIHPFFLYGSFLAVFFSFSFTFNHFFLTKLTLLKLALVAFLLGGYWGLGNSVWGYFWVNDLIEWLLLLLTTFLVFYIHSFSTKTNLTYFIVGVTAILFYLWAIRLGLLITRHSFFNLTNLKNIFYLFFLLYLNIKFFIAILITKLAASKFIGYCAVGYFSYLVLAHYFFSAYLIIIHALVVVLFLIWSKYTPHNFSYLFYNRWISHPTFQFSLNEIASSSWLRRTNVTHTIVQVQLYSYYFFKKNVMTFIFIKYCATLYFVAVFWIRKKR